MPGISGEEEEQPARRSALKNVRLGMRRFGRSRLTKKDDGDGD